MHEYRRILAIVDFSGPGALAARRALKLARMGNAELAFLHWIQPDLAVDGGYPAPSHAATRRAYEDGAQRRLRFLAGHLDADDTTLLTAYGASSQTVAEAISAWAPDLVVAAEEAEHLCGRHDLLTLGRARAGGGRLARLVKGLAMLLAGKYAY